MKVNNDFVLIFLTRHFFFVNEVQSEFLDTSGTFFNNNNMDVDNASSDGSVTGGGGIDIEQSFLQQFSCLGTTDKHELVQQLQKLLGSQLNYSTATFFLDMNNW